MISFFYGESESAKIAFITAIYGPYEASCKKFVKQTIPADFICFTNLTKLDSNGWIIDRNPYHLTHKCPFDSSDLINSLQNNTHTFNIAKYYKQNFQSIPRLKNYDVVVWLDGTIEITHPKTAEWVVNKIKEHPIITWEHEYRRGKLFNEVTASMQCERYPSTYWFGQSQPFQDVLKQYKEYLKNGYDDHNYWHSIDPKRKHFGVWVTCFIAFDNHSPQVGEFLNMWYLQTLKYTTQDQVGFPYVAQKLRMHPYTLPDHQIKGFGHTGTDFYIKHSHGR